MLLVLNVLKYRKTELSFSLFKRSFQSCDNHDNFTVMELPIHEIHDSVNSWRLEHLLIIAYISEHSVKGILGC